jgi:hypothetical protein
MNANHAYAAIASALGKAVEESDRPRALHGAIRAMQICPGTCARIRCFNDTLWEIIEDTLNANTRIKDTESFEHACAVLESMDGE